MDKKEISEKVTNIIKDFKNSPNKDLIFVMDILQKDFETTKDSLIKLTHHLDSIESTYNDILKEYNRRTNGK
jgi:hypothetical protein